MSTASELQLAAFNNDRNTRPRKTRQPTFTPSKPPNKKGSEREAKKVVADFIARARVLAKQGKNQAKIMDLGLTAVSRCPISKDWEIVYYPVLPSIGQIVAKILRDEQHRFRVEVRPNESLEKFSLWACW